MKLATYQANGVTRTGIVVADTIIDTGIGGSMIDLIARWDELKPQLEARAAGGGGIPLASVRLCPPVPRPGKIFAIGLNYAEHIEETGRSRPERQIWFTKAQTSVNGPYDPILIARGSTHVDYEIELVAVIGTRAKHVSVADAAAHIFGYCVGNDVSERLWQQSSPQWALGKSFDTHAPMGPWITTADELGDPHRLDIRCLVNGQPRQSSNTRQMIFDIWHQVEHLSSAMTLEPGDVIFTGTPSGVGVAMNPRQYLKAGDVVRCEIAQLGAIEAVMAQED